MLQQTAALTKDCLKRKMINFTRTEYNFVDIQYRQAGMTYIIPMDFIGNLQITKSNEFQFLLSH